MDLFARLTALPRAPMIGMAVAMAVALICLVVPITLLERLVSASGLPALFAAAEPPLGLTARIAMAAAGGIFACALTTLTLFVTLGTFGGRTVATDAPVLRKADAHPDAPARRPIFAGRDLGTPFLDIKADAEPLPVLDLRNDDVFRPAALAKTPVPFVPESVPPLPPAAPLPEAAPPAPSFAAAQRDARPAFEPAIVAPRADPLPRALQDDEPITAPETAATIHALLDRLERGVARHQPAIRSVPLPTPRAAGGEEAALREALGSLRRLAMRPV